jgi:hypothetical protein
VDFGYGIRFAQQLRYRGMRGRRGHGCPVGDIDRGEPNARKLGACFHFDTFDRDAETLGFAIQIIAITGCQREHEKLATVNSRAFARAFWRHA